MISSIVRTITREQKIRRKRRNVNLSSAHAMAKNIQRKVIITSIFDILYILCALTYVIEIPLTIVYEFNVIWVFIILDVFFSIWFIIYIICTLFGLINLTLFRESQKKSGKKHPFRIRLKKYVLTLWFFLDAVSLLPIDLIILAAMSGHSLGYKVYRYVRLIKLFRIPRVYKLFDFPQDIVIHARIRQLFNAIVFFFYCIAALHLSGMLFLVLSSLTFADSFTGYVTAIYWVFGTLTTVGYGDIEITSSGERIYAIIVMILGVGAYSYVIGNVSIILLKKDTVEASQRKELQDLIALMKFYGIPKSDQHNVVDLYSYVQKQSTIDSFSTVISRLPQSMQQEIKDFARIHMIRDFPLFKKTSHACLVDIARALKPVYTDPGEVIIKYKDVGKEMFFIAYGTLEVLSPDGTHLVNINKGFFGELALFFNTKRTATIRSLSYCSLLKLEKEDFEPIMKQRSELAVIVKHHIQKKLIEIPSLYKSLGDHEFQFETDDNGLLALTENDLRTAFTSDFPWIKLVYEQNKLHSTVRVQHELIQLHQRSIANLNDISKKKNITNTSYSENDKVIVQLTIVGAKQLAAMDIGGRSDPFVIVSSKNSTYRTKIKKRTLEPEWNEKFLLTVEPDEIIECLMFDHDIIGSNDFLGAHEISVKNLPFGETQLYWSPLKDTKDYQAKYKQGRLNVQVLKSSLFDRDLARCKEDLIELKLVSGSELIACDLSGTSDPYCLVTCDNEKYKTKVKIKNLSPVWNETCYFVANPEDDILIELFDLDYIGSDDIMGQLVLPIHSIPRNETILKTSSLKEVSSGKLTYQIKRISMLEANIQSLKKSFGHAVGMKFSNSFGNRVLTLLDSSVPADDQIRAYSLVVKNELRLRNFDVVEDYIEKIEKLSTSLLGNLRVKNIIIEYLIISNQFSRAVKQLAECMKLIYPDYPHESGPNSLHLWIKEKIQFLVQNKDQLIKLSVEYRERYEQPNYMPSESELEFIEFQQSVKICAPALFVTSSSIVHSAQVLMAVLSIEREVFGIEASMSGIGYSILNHDHSLTSKIIQFAEVDVTRARSVFNKLSYTGYFYATFMPFAQCNAYHQFEVLQRSFEDGISTGEPIFTPINGLSALFVSLHVSTNLQSQTEFFGLLTQLQKEFESNDNDIYQCLLYDIENIYLTLVSGTHPVRDYPIDVEDHLLTRYFHHLSSSIIEYLRGNFRYSVKFMILANADVDALFPSVFSFYHIIWNIIICGSLQTTVPSDGGPVTISNMPLVLDMEKVEYVEKRSETLMKPLYWMRMADEARIENNKPAKEIINMYRRVIAECNQTRLTILSNITKLRLVSYINQVGFGPTFTSVSLQQCYQSWHQYGARGICDMIYLSFETEMLHHDSTEFRKCFDKQKQPQLASVSKNVPTILHKDLKINFRELYVKELESFVNFIGASRGCIIIQNIIEDTASVVCTYVNNTTTFAECPIEEPQRKLFSRMKATKKHILVQNIMADRSFEYDIFLVQKNIKSLLAIPILECINNHISLKGMIYFEKSHSFSKADHEIISTLVENHYRTTRFELEKLFMMKFLPDHILDHVPSMDITPKQLKKNQPTDYCVVCKHSHSATKKKYKSQISSLQKKEMAVILPDLSNDALFHSSTVKELRSELLEKQKTLERQEKLIVKLLKERESPNAADPSINHELHHHPHTPLSLSDDNIDIENIQI